MKIEDFKNMCIARRKEEDEFIAKHKHLISIQNDIFSCRCYRPVYKIFGGIFCPACGKKLVRMDIGGVEYILYCVCGYDYAGNDPIDY